VKKIHTCWQTEIDSVDAAPRGRPLHSLRGLIIGQAQIAERLSRNLFLGAARLLRRSEGAVHLGSVDKKNYNEDQLH
jgi:hypothetical protein